MTTSTAGSRFGRFVATAFVVAAAIAALGFLPTRRLAGDAGVPAMLAGCAIGFVSAMAAGVFLVLVRADTPDARMKRSFLAMTARLGAAVGLGAAMALSGLLSTQPLLLWIAIAYVALLPLEVRLAIYG
jgi:hypothetical protein